jgi:pyridoxamine 5'-phosphate oxidase
MELPAEVLERLQDCMDAAVKAKEIEPNAMTLATMDGQGNLSARMVLLKGYDERGFVFYTNTLSTKGRQLAVKPRAALIMYWKTTERQVRIEGSVEPVTDDEADEYFATRHRGSQLGAWASRQSEPLKSRAHLLKKVLEVELKYAGGPVPRPPHWSGYRVLPDMVEFWYGRSSRLHDRFRFKLVGDEWTRQRLYP